MFGEKIREIRLRKYPNKNLREVSSEMGISLGHLSDLETMKANNPSLKTILKICNYLELEPGELLDKEGVS